MDKTIVVFRGLPGSGKSTLLRRMGGTLDNTCCTNHYFKDSNEEYIFDSTKLMEAHNWCRLKCKEMMEKEVPMIFVDNTNIQLWEMVPYVLLAKSFKYKIEVISVNTNLNDEELSLRNKHDVPVDVVSKMRFKFESLDPVDVILREGYDAFMSIAEEDHVLDLLRGVDIQNLDKGLIAQMHRRKHAKG